MNPFYSFSIYLGNNMNTLRKYVLLSVKLFIFLVSMFIISSCKGGSDPATIVSFEVSPTNPSIALGTTQQFKVTAIYSDNTTQDFTAAVTWSSSDTGVATISNAAGSNGLATSVSTGTTTITATSGSISATMTLTVTPATLVSIGVTPTNPSIAKGTKQQFTATGTYSDKTNKVLTNPSPGPLHIQMWQQSAMQQGLMDLPPQ